MNMTPDELKRLEKLEKKVRMILLILLSFKNTFAIADLEKLGDDK
jgi:hypothetical protein